MIDHPADLCLVGITPGDGRDLRPWIDALRGLDALILREPALSEVLAKRAVDHMLSVGLRPIWHVKTPGDPGSNWVHGPTGTPVREPTGWSCHTPEELDAAFAAGCSWALLSPVWPPTSKPLRGQALGVERFVDWAEDRNVLALGGVTPERYASLREAGVRGAAVLGDLFGQSSPEAAARRLIDYR